ncbi:uncharacterized protein At4g19900-like [Magnolia sinica]|uniref:uncharacterized protein At4g19900-like n=1 Tax=Magnolia sinica TaxID=86752 RepID=UPI0026587D1E|nr:uncharacterized protein At4g19900-like [Magnolia sinica]
MKLKKPLIKASKISSLLSLDSPVLRDESSPSHLLFSIIQIPFLSLLSFMSFPHHEKKSLCIMFKFSSLFSTLSLAAFLLLLLLTISAFSNFSLHSVAFRSKRPTWVFPSDKARVQFKSKSSPAVLLSVEEEVWENYVQDPGPVLPPINVTIEKRIKWFIDNINEFKIIRSNGLTRKFAVRAQEFFDDGCDARFFMTWISPVILFGHREFLALESLFKAHRFGCLMILSTTMDSRRGSQVLKPLVDAGFRVIAVTPDLPFLLRNTPAGAWFNELKKGNVDPGEIPLAQNLSNLLRLAVLYKYGGIYLDTDFIVMKKLTALRNSIGAQAIDAETGNWSRLNNAVLIFDKQHPLLFKFIDEFSLTFNGNKWGHNGPYLVSRVVARVAKRPGYNFNVLPPMAFYPVDWTKIGGLFKRPENPATSRWVAAKLLQLSGETYAIHLWNRQSNNLKIEEGSVMGRLISDHCLFYLANCCFFQTRIMKNMRQQRKREKPTRSKRYTEISGS